MSENGKKITSRRKGLPNRHPLYFLPRDELTNWDLVSRLMCPICPDYFTLNAALLFHLRVDHRIQDAKSFLEEKRAQMIRNPPVVDDDSSETSDEEDERLVREDGSWHPVPREARQKKKKEEEEKEQKGEEVDLVDLSDEEGGGGPRPAVGAVATSLVATDTATNGAVDSPADGGATAETGPEEGSSGTRPTLLE